MSSIDAYLSQIDVVSLPEDAFFGNVMYEPAGTYGPRMQTHYQLVAMNKGEAKVYIDGDPFSLRQGEVALLHPGHNEFFEFTKAAQTYHSWCHFSWDLPAELARRAAPLRLKLPLSNRMERLIDLGLSLHHDPCVLAPSLSHLAAAAFWEYMSAARLDASSTRSAPLPESVKRVQAYISNYYYLALDLPKLGEVAFVTPEHLTRLFNRHLGVSPMRYLWQVRTRQGVSFIKHSNRKFEQIAFSCGFKTAAHFSRSVKAATGRTPSEVRAHHAPADASA